MLQPMIAWIIFGGDEGIRTPGLLHAKQALSQLSHTPTGTNSILALSKWIVNIHNCTGIRSKRKIFCEFSGKALYLLLVL